MNTRQGRRYSRWVIFFLSGLFAAHAAGSTIQDSAQPLSIEQVEKQVEFLKTETGLEDVLRQQALNNLLQATENLKRAAALSDATAEYEHQLQQAPTTLATIRQELASPAPTTSPAPDPAKPLASWEQDLLQATADREAAQQKLAELEAEDKKRTARRSELPGLFSAAIARGNELTEELALPFEQAEDSALLAQSVQWDLLSARQEAAAAAAAYEKELQGYDTYRELLTARRDRTARKLATAETLVSTLQQQVDRQRHQESEAAAAKANQARDAAATLNPAIQAIANRNAALAALRTGEGGLAMQLRNAARQLQEAKDLIATVQNRADELQQRISAAGLTHAVAQLLRRERDNLPDVRRYRPRFRTRREEIAQVQLTLLDFNDQRKALLDIGGQVDALVAASGVAEKDRKSLMAQLTDYLTTQRAQLDTLITENNIYFSTLVDLDIAERKLVANVAVFSEAIAEHILWVRSDPPFELQTLRKAADGLTWLAQPLHWKETGRVLLNHIQHHPLEMFILLLAEILLGFYYIFSARRLRTIAIVVSRIRTDRFVYTVEALIHTALRAAPAPLALFTLGWWLSQPGSGNAVFAAAVGVASLGTSLMLAANMVLYEACLPKGLMEEHFDWKPSVLRPLRKMILQLVLTAAPLFWLVLLLGGSPEGPETNTLERLLFFTLHLALLGLAITLLRNKSDFIQMLTDQATDHRLLRSRRLLLSLAIGVSTVIMVADILGYYYTAGQMAGWLSESILLAMTVFLMEALLMRGIQIVARRAEFERRVKERQEAHRQKEGEESATPETLPEEELDVVAISENTKKLLHASVVFGLLFGMWFIWGDAVPALNLLDQIGLWTVQTESAIDGIQYVVISWADLLAALVAGMITIVAARNLPGLLELAVLRHLPIAYGERYAISTIIRYVIVGTGVAMAFSMLGVGWSKIRWLVAALSVGLGFGLQEIFANFISGLILLFERPIRVRDFVTVGTTSGQVSRIQIRATTITDFDNKELLIPNKQFVTGELVNWTLTNSVLRVVVPVGIAYGSDTKKAERILLDIARHYRMAVEEPAPSAFFAGFGDSTLNFELRVFISQAEKFREARHELNMAVDDEFRKAGIVIAFPQRDLHIYSADNSIKPEDLVLPEQK